MTTPDLLAHIAALPPNWHSAGTLTARALQAIDAWCRERGPLDHSIETGSGRSTLLLSNRSQHHLVFALDDGTGSIAQVRSSPLFNASTVTFVEGPTQTTLPRADLPASVQLALLDGPHAYPFPDLEYFFIYPRLAPKALLIIDDIQIPSINNMFRVIRADRMFDLIEVVDNTAFFERSAAPTFNPYGDEWFKQGFNEAVYSRSLRRQRRRKTFAESIPLGIRGLLPPALKRLIYRRLL